MKHYHVLYLLPLLLCTASSAIENNAEINVSRIPDEMSEKEENRSETWSLDSFQRYWSRKIQLFSSNLDQKISELYEEDNVSDVIPDAPSIEQESYVASGWMDEFFKNETYLDTSNKSYARIRGGYELNKLGGPSFFHNITARIRLPKTEGRLQLYIGEDVVDNTNLSYVQYKSSNEGVGLKYFLPSFFENVSSTASVGFSRLDNPYAKLRFEYPIFAGKWLFKPSQNFKYSMDKELEEWTNFYIDRKLADDEILRLLLQRSTQSGLDGMNYLTQLSYMNTRKYKLGFNYYLSMSGRTQDLRNVPYENGMIPREGVYEYAAGMIWRQKLYKDYLFYQVQPILSYHEQYDFSPNPILRMSLDLYFGNHR